MSESLAKAHATEVLAGRTLGEFVLREHIGEGGFAAVFRADQPALGREAVVKVLHQRLRASEVVQLRFMREARLASRLDHPYAAHVYGFGIEPDGLVWIAMEMVHGMPFDRWLAEHRALDLDRFLAFFDGIAEVVHTAHERGIVHRDLKPSNVMVIERAGRLMPKLLDFGIAKLVDDTAHVEPPTPLPARGEPLPGATPPTTVTLTSSPAAALSPLRFDQQLTQANTTLGSPPYMSPEQWIDPLAVGPRSDLYSLGVMAYETLTGRRPFTAETVAELAVLHCTAPPPPLGPEFPAALDRALVRALAKQPADRPPTALVLMAEIRAACAPAPAPAVAHEPVPAPRSRWPVVIAAALVATAAAATAIVVVTGDRGSPGTHRAPPRDDTVAAVVPAPPAADAPAVAAAVDDPSVAAADAARSVTVAITSSPRGADVYRWPANDKVGSTPFTATVSAEDRAQVYVVKKRGFADGRVEIDLRTGGSRTVKLSRPSRDQPSTTGRTPTPTTPARPPEDLGENRL